MDIRFEISIAADPAVVFEAVTTRKGYQGWWTSTCDIDPALNGESSIRFEKEEGTEEMRFVTQEYLPDRKFVWRCIANNVFASWVGAVFVFEIEKNKGGSRLIFTQSSDRKNWNKHADYRPSVDGWAFFMDSLRRYCETGEGEPWS
jgi:uncharacterized protein YndB with AHSA1/START domain